MTQLLHIDCSARRESFSRELSMAFADTWRDVNPDGSYVYRDLAGNPVPPVDEARTQIAELAAAAGVTRHGEIGALLTSPEQKTSWGIAEPLIDELLAADILLVGTPMYNFSIPSTLKAWIDQITFNFLDLKDKRVIIAASRGGAYGPGTPREAFNYQDTYLKVYFEALGVKDFTFLGTEFTLSNVVPFLAQFKDMHATSRRAALDAARSLAVGGDLPRHPESEPGGWSERSHSSPQRGRV